MIKEPKNDTPKDGAPSAPPGSANANKDARLSALLAKSREKAQAKDLDARTFKPETPGDELVGRVVNMGEQFSAMRKGNQLLLTIVPLGQPPEMATRFYCSPMAETQVKAQGIAIGDPIMILYRGEKGTPNGMMKEYSIVRIEDDGVPF